ncbi:hypothetical protein [Mycobacterium riyadhense]|uniref:hypothetical protein n=3 Tax=Mycobacterium riyadhense TaxID=486698 RepID=UPI00195E98BC|nr:hypothetical protein [Mycobacterium riyadhense]
MIDSMSAALTAVTLIETAVGADDRLQIAAALLPDNLPDTHLVLSSAVWCAHHLAESLAEELGVDIATVKAALRDEVAERFQNYNPTEEQ